MGKRKKTFAAAAVAEKFVLSISSFISSLAIASKQAS